MEHHYYHNYFKKSALKGWETVDTLYQCEDSNPTEPTHRMKVVKEKTV